MCNIRVLTIMFCFFSLLKRIFSCTSGLLFELACKVTSSAGYKYTWRVGKEGNEKLFPSGGEGM